MSWWSILIGGRDSLCLCSLQMEFEQCKADLSVALETERKKICDLTQKLGDELGRHADTQTLLEQVTP